MESRISTEEMVQKIVGDHLGIPGPAVHLESHIVNDLGADSLDRLELIMTIEELFRIRLAEEEVAKIERINDIVEAIRRARRLGGRSTSEGFVLGDGRVLQEDES